MILTLLTILACPADLSACRRESIEMTGGYVGAQAALMEWLGEHEGYRVISWRMRR